MEDNGWLKRGRTDALAQPTSISRVEFASPAQPSHPLLSAPGASIHRYLRQALFGRLGLSSVKQEIRRGRSWSCRWQMGVCPGFPANEDLRADGRDRHPMKLDAGMKRTCLRCFPIWSLRFDTRTGRSLKGVRSTPAAGGLNAKNSRRPAAQRRVPSRRRIPDQSVPSSRPFLLADAVNCVFPALRATHASPLRSVRRRILARMSWASGEARAGA